MGTVAAPGTGNVSQLLIKLLAGDHDLIVGEINFQGNELDDFADGFSRDLPGLASPAQLQRTSDVAANNLQ
jgi:hypothetical protein